MNVYYPHDPRDPSIPRGIALGFFDGVHRGHQDLIRTLAFACERSQLRPAVFTFPEHPLVTISPEGQFAGYLSTLSQRLQRIADNGAEEVFLEDFTPEFAALPPLDFLETILAGQLNARLIVVGQDYHFGRDGEGDLQLLSGWATAKGIELIAVPDVQIYGEKISSSRVRRLIAQGDTQMAASCLGIPFQMTGTVIEGKKLGRKLGFPTANIEIAPELAIPAFGVYATRTRVGSRTYESITNIGIRPTIQDASPKPNIESFLFDTEMCLYGEQITVEFLYRMRPEETYDNLLDLVAQVQRDLEAARAFHRSNEQGYELARVGDIPVRVLKTTRFAQATAIVTFTTRINRLDASLFSLLTRLMSASCRKYPSRSGLSAALDSLYGASVETEVSKDGDLLNLHFAVNGLMHWTDHTSPFAASLDLLFELLLEPDLDEQGHFHSQNFEAESQGLQMELLARENDKAKYALDQCMKLLCGDQVFGLRASGDLESLADIRREDLIHAYHRLLAELECQVAIAGDLSGELIDAVLKQTARLRSRGRREVAPETADQPFAEPATDPAGLKSPRTFYQSDNLLRPSAFSPAPAAEVREEKNVEQARICLAFSGLQPYFSHHSIVDTLMNSMLGGDVHSLLFDVVREQLGLAYSVYSVNSRYLSTLLVIAGVSPDRVDEAHQAITGQIRNLAEGRFAPQLFDRAKTLVESHIRSIPDDLDTLLSHLMNGVTLGRSISVQDSLSLLAGVTMDQVVNQARSLALETSYILTARGGAVDD